MYTMTVDGRLLYNPRIDEYAIENPTVTQDANRFATLTFTIYPNHPEYAGITKRRSVIAIYEDGTLVMNMRAIKSKLNFRGGITYTCEEWAAVLNDIVRRPSYYSGTPAQYLASLISDFNSRYTGMSPVAPAAYLDIDVPLYRGTTGSDVRKLQTNLTMLGYRLPQHGIDGIFGDETANAVKRFRVDNGLSNDYVFDQDALTVMSLIFNPPEEEEEETDPFSAGTVEGISTDTAEFINDDYIGYWDLMQEKLVEVYGGYIIPRYTAGGIVIDYLTEEYLPLSTQSIVFGENMADLFVETDATDTFSVLIPLGADVRATNIHEGQAKQTPLTIASVNNSKDYLENADGLTLYGRREMVYRWEEVKDASTLKSLGEQYLAEYSVRLADSVSLNAVDLKNVNVNAASLKWMTRINVESEKHGVTEVYALTKKTTPLGAPKTTKIQLGSSRKALTDRIADNAARASRAYSELSGRMFSVENPEEE